MNPIFIDYNVIGGHHGGEFISCVVGAADSYSRFDKKHRTFMYEMIAVASDLGYRLINDDKNIQDFCSMEAGTSRRLKPKPSDDEGTLLHHLAMRIFSTDSKENDNNATVYGRVIEFFWREKIEAEYVIDFLRDNGGIYGVYDLVVEKYPRRSNEPMDDDTTVEQAAKSDGGTTRSSTPSTFLTLPTVPGHAITAGGGNDSIQNAECQIVEINASNSELARFLQLNQGEKLSTVIECVEWRDEWIVLKFTAVRDYPVILYRQQT